MVNLTPEEQYRRKELTEKLETRTLNVQEAEELRQLLEKEKKQATSTGDVVTVIAIAILIGLVVGHLSKD